MSKEYERGVEQASAIYKEVIREYVAENAKLLKERDEWRRVAESKQDIIDHMRDANAENSKLRGYVQTLETANLDVTSRLQDYIGQYDPTDAFVIEVKAENTRLRKMLAEGNEELAKMRRVIDYLYSFAKACGVDAEDMRELGIEV